MVDSCTKADNELQFGPIVGPYEIDRTSLNHGQNVAAEFVDRTDQLAES